MPDCKRQHYVPQFYLRNFSEDGKTIGCCHFDMDGIRIIKDAPIRTQACKDYFYTKDIRLEKAFSQIEGDANALIQKILSGYTSFTRTEEELLKQYVFFQNIRTPFHANEFESAMIKMYRTVAPEDDSEIQLEGKQIFVLHTLLPFAAKLTKLYKPVILENRMDIPFITSSEPAVHLNPYQMKRTQEAYGVGTYGGIFYMALSANKGVLLYDYQAYRMKGRRKVMCAPSDVAYLNDLIINYAGHSKANRCYYDSRTDMHQIIALSNQYLKKGGELSFMRERFHLFGIPDRRSLFPEEELHEECRMSAEEFKSFIQKTKKKY